MPEEAITVSSVIPPVRGFLHRPPGLASAALVLTHGAGSNANAPLLVALAKLLVERNIVVLRCDLPYRQRRPFGPPRGSAAEDQAGLERAVEVMRQMAPAKTFLGGASYGGRQATMLAAAKPGVVDGLLILSYPLHAPGRPDQPRVAHLAKLKTPAVFVSGDKDPFGSPEELRKAVSAMPAQTSLTIVPGVGHDLGFGRAARARGDDVAAQIVGAFERMFLSR